MGGTSLLALATQTTFVWIDIREVVLYGDGTKGTFLLALATADTTHLTCLHRYGTFVLVNAGYIYSPTLWAFLAEFDDVSWTSISTGTAGCTFLLIDLCNARLWIDMNGIKLTSLHTVATT